MLVLIASLLGCHVEVMLLYCIIVYYYCIVLYCLFVGCFVHTLACFPVIHVFIHSFVNLFALFYFRLIYFIKHKHVLIIAYTGSWTSNCNIHLSACCFSCLRVCLFVFCLFSVCLLACLSVCLHLYLIDCFLICVYCFSSSANKLNLAMTLSLYADKGMWFRYQSQWWHIDLITCLHVCLFACKSTNSLSIRIICLRFSQFR